MNDSKSLSHPKWNCKYHIVFAPKHHRQVIYGEIKVDIVKMLNGTMKQSWFLKISRFIQWILDIRNFAQVKGMGKVANIKDFIDQLDKMS